MTKLHISTLLALLIISIIIDGSNCQIHLNDIKDLKNLIRNAKVELKFLETDRIQSIWYSKLVSTSDASLNLVQRLYDIQYKYKSILPNAEKLELASVDKFVDRISSNIGLMIKASLPMLEKPFLAYVWEDLRLDHGPALERFRIKFFLCQYERLKGLMKPDTMNIIEKYIAKIENDLPSGNLNATNVEKQLSNFKSSINLIFDDFCGLFRGMSIIMRTIWKILLDQMDDSKKYSKLSQKTNKLTPGATKIVNFLNEKNNYIKREWKANSQALISIRDETIFTIDAIISMLQFCFSQLIKKRGKSSGAEEAFTQTELNSIQIYLETLLIAANKNQAAEAKVQLSEMSELFYEKYLKLLDAEGEYEVVLKMLNSFKLSPLQKFSSIKSN